MTSAQWCARSLPHFFSSSLYLTPKDGQAELTLADDYVPIVLGWSSHHLILYSLKAVVERNGVQSS